MNTHYKYYTPANTVQYMYTVVYSTYEVCEETNAQGNITWKRFILERHLIQVIFWHDHQQYVCFFCPALSTLGRRRQAFK